MVTRLPGRLFNCDHYYDLNLCGRPIALARSSAPSLDSTPFQIEHR